MNLDVCLGAAVADPTHRHRVRVQAMEVLGILGQPGRDAQSVGHEHGPSLHARHFRSRRCRAGAICRTWPLSPGQPAISDRSPIPSGPSGRCELEAKSCHARRVRIEIPLFDGFDELDAFGPFEVLAGAGFDVELVGAQAVGRVVSQRGVRIDTTAALGRPDAVIVPGGGWQNRAPEGAWAQVRRRVLPDRLQELAASTRFLASVCTGSMLLAAAGVLDGRYATTNRNALEELRSYNVEVVDERVVDDSTVITAAGLTAGIDLGLWIIERELGTAAADKRARSIEYTRQGRVWLSPQAQPKSQ